LKKNVSGGKVNKTEGEKRLDFAKKFIRRRRWTDDQKRDAVLWEPNRKGATAKTPGGIQKGGERGITEKRRAHLTSRGLSAEERQLSAG